MYKLFLKRFFDIFITILVFPLLVIMFLLIYILIKLDDGGPIFYNGERIGKNSKPFKMYKFRTMKVGSPNILNSDGSTYNSSDDERVTKIGKILRESSLDELPQFVNVLKGEMSIIGPRASLYSVLNTYKDDEIDKMNVRPGITGYTQAYYRNSLSNKEKRIKDAWYANNYSFKLDVKIFIQTLKTVTKSENIYTKGN